MSSNAPSGTDSTFGAGLWRRVLLVTVVFSIVATACGGGGTTTTEAASGSPAAADPDGANALLVGSFETFGGDTIDLQTVHDSDVVLWFWAPW